MGGSIFIFRMCRCRLIYCRIGVFLLLIFFIPASAKPEDNLRNEMRGLHPYVSVTTALRDNIHYTPTTKLSDYSVTTTPGIKFQFPLRMHMFTLDYNTAMIRYSKYTSENTTDHNFSGMFDFKFGSLLGLKVMNNYSRDHEAKGSSYSGIIERYEANTVAASVSYHLADISKVEIDYTMTTWDFMTSNLRDRDENLMSGYVYYRFLPKTSAFLEYDRKDIYYDLLSNNPDSKEQSAFFGLKWGIYERSNGVIKGGYLWKDFESLSEEDYETWISSINLNHRFTDYTVVSLANKRVVKEAAIRDTDFILSNESDVKFIHRFSERIDVILSGSYSKDDFSNVAGNNREVREDVAISGGIGLKYTVQEWLSLALDYEHEERDSNINNYDYDNNAYLCTLSLAL